MSGLDFARAVKALQPDSPVAITSGYISEELRAQAPAAGVSELIYKPNTVEELFAAVDRLARSVLGPLKPN
jgi:CheY-like chemotaxis protein